MTTLTWTPPQALEPNTSYTACVRGLIDIYGGPWSCVTFTTAELPIPAAPVWRSPTEGDSTTSLIGQVRLIAAKQLHIFAQIFGDKVGDADMSNKGVRVWFMYIF